MGVGLWAAACAICTGDAASVLMFGSIGTLGLAGAPVLDAKKAKHHGAEWGVFADAASSAHLWRSRAVGNAWRWARSDGGGQH